MIRCLLIPLTGVLLALPAPAQTAPVAGTAAEKAAQAMEAMDTLDAMEAAKAPGGKTTGNPETEAAPAPVNPPLLPASPDPAQRGMDLLNRARLDTLMPAGRSHQGVHYPMYGAAETDYQAERTPTDPLTGAPQASPATAGLRSTEAPLASLFESNLVTRLDNDHIQFDRAKWIQYETAAPGAPAPGQPTMTLEIESGIYDLKSEILMTNQPVRIENRQFLITGDTMLHDRASGLTRLTGRVHMTFYNEEPEARAKAAPPSKPVPVPAKTPP